MTNKKLESCPHISYIIYGLAAALLGSLATLTHAALPVVPPPALAPARAEGFLDKIQITGNTLKSRGWAGAGDSANPVAGISIVVDEVEIHSGGFEKQPRPDVAQAKGRSDWLESGFLIQAPINAPLSERPRKFTATAPLKNGDHFDLRVPEETLTVGPAAPAMPVANPPQLLGQLDEVVLEGNQLKVRGWVASADPAQQIQTILLKSGKETLYRGAFQIEERPDVAKALGKPDLVNAGWIVRLDWSGKPAPSSITPHFETQTGEILLLPVPAAIQAPSAETAPPEALMSTRLAWLAAFLLAGGLGLLIYQGYQPGRKFVIFCGRYTQSRLITLCLGFALALMCLVAFKGRFNAHPDEAGHFNAVNYYSENWFKQKVDSPEMLNTLIPQWGISYLHLKDFTYFFTNKISSIFSPLGLEIFVKYRLFNILLFLVMLIVFKDKTWQGFCFLVCANLVPQIWYIFSYINGDGISFFLTMSTCYYFVTNKSKIVDFFWGGEIHWRQMFCFTLLCCGVLFARLHFFIVVPFVLAVIFILGLDNFSKHSLSRFFVKLGSFMLVLGAIYFVDRIIDESVNGFRKTELLLEIKKSYADPTLLKEHILNSGVNPHLMFAKEFGISFNDLFFKRNLNWFTSSFQSFIGTFGYMNLNCSYNYYVLSTVFCIMPVVMAVLLLFFLSEWKLRIVFILGIFTIVAIVIQSMMHSWVYSFQAQGRYMFAIFPVLATMLSLSSWNKFTGIARKWFISLLIINIYGYGVYAFHKLIF
jgi:hypothetical protein